MTNFKEMDGQSAQISTSMLKEENEDLWVELRDFLSDMIPEGAATKQDVQEFEEGKWEVTFHFTESELHITAGRDGQHCNNQEPWAKIPYDELEKYYSEEEKSWLTEIAK